jgi:prepilin-type N-terminal cleavage/methylation domain-containing protein
MDKLNYKRSQRGLPAQAGFSLIELLIAMAIALMTISAIIFAVGGNQSTVSDSEINAEAVLKAQDLIGQAVASSTKNFASIVANTSTDCAGSLCYTKSISVPLAYATQCAEAIVGTVSWMGTYGRSLSVSETSMVTDIPTLLALGGDCITTPPSGGWKPPVPYASDALNPGKPTSIDAVSHIAYMGFDHSPYLQIADARSAVLGQNSGLFITFSNSFNSSGNVLDQINGLAIAKDPTSGKTYLFAATASTTAALSVIDVSDIYNPVIVARKSLAGTTAQGWKLFYYNKRVYIVSQLTSGPEFHVFDVTTPTSPTELGSGYELNATVNDLTVSNGIAYLATATGKELVVLNVANPSSISEITGASKSPGGSAAAESLFLNGTKLYLGLASNSGPEVYLLDASSPLTASGGLPTIASKEIGNDVVGIRVAGPIAFLGVSHASEEFQIWSSDLSGGAISIYNFGNVISAGFDYDNDWVFASGQSSPNLTILYSPPPFSYTLSNTGNISVVQGSAGNTSITKTYVSGTATSVFLSASGLPAGATATFSNNPCTPTCASTVTISTTFPTTLAGTYPITVSGGSQTTTFNLVVSAQPFDYALSNSAPVGGVTVIRAGATANTNVSAAVVTGTGSVSFSNSSLPSGVSVSYSLPSCTPTCTTALTFTASDVATVGSASVTVTGSSPMHTTSFTLNVTAPTFSYILSSPADVTIVRGGATVPLTITATGVAGAVQQLITMTPPNPGGGVIVSAPSACTPSSTSPYTCSVTFNYSAPLSATKKPYSNQQVTATPGAIPSGKFKIIVN